MAKINRLSPKTQGDIIHAYDVELATMQDLADRNGVTRQSIWRLLRRSGIDTSKRRIPVSCTACGKTIYRTKARIRNATHLFCDAECYHAFLEAGQGNLYMQSRQGQQRARSLVERYIRLEHGQIVHHEDRNTFNNHPSNLRVFANQGDHIRYHRLGPDYVSPIWDGRTV